MLCPSCGSQIDDPKSGVCAHCGWQMQTGAAPAEPVVSVSMKPRKIPVAVDLVMDIDITASSLAFSQGIVESAATLLDHLQRKARALRVWVVTHGDRDCGQPPRLVADAAEPQAALEAIRRLRFAGGGDPPEHHLDAWEWILDFIPLSDDPTVARGCIVSFTTAGSKPATSGRSPKEIGARVADKNIVACLVCERVAELEELCNAANGFLFPISATPARGEMEKVAKLVARSIVASATKLGDKTLVQDTYST